MNSLQKEQTKTPFDIWAGDTKYLTHIDSFEDFNSKTGYTIPVFHGTTHDFDIFNVKKSWIESQFGQMIYLTTSEYDAQINYTDSGPDLKMRIDLKAERLGDEISENPLEMGLATDTPTDEEIETHARQLAEEEMMGQTPQVLSLYVKLKKPLIINGTDYLQPKIYMEYLSSIEDIDIDTDEFDPDEDHDDQWNDAHNAACEDRDIKIRRAFNNALFALNITEDICVPENLFEYDYDGTTNSFESILTETLGDLCCETTGSYLANAMVSAFAKELGYDSIILLDANQRFRTMSMDQKTAHIHIFDTWDGEQCILKSTDSDFISTDNRFTA
jgi:hypothetical protein